jgi:hypothetical protein
LDSRKMGLDRFESRAGSIEKAEMSVDPFLSAISPNR